MNLFRKLGRFLRREKLDAEMREEMRAHLDLQAAENTRRGMGAAEARAAAQRAFGGAEQIKERCRDERARGFVWLEQLAQDLRLGGRALLRHHRGFACVTMAVLALGIGANTALWSVIEAVLFRAMPVPEPDRLVAIAKAAPAGVAAAPWFSFPLFETLKADAKSFSGLTAIGRSTRLLSTRTLEPVTVKTHEVAGDFFATLGLHAALGRTLTPEDDRPGRANFVAVISDALWHARFGADPAIVGRTIEIDQKPFTIVGVAPADFTGAIVGSEAQLWLPLQAIPQLDTGFYGQRLQQETLPWLVLMGRLRPGVTRDAAEVETDFLCQREYRAQEQTLGALPEARRRDLFEHKIVLQAGGAGFNAHLWAQSRPLLALLGGVSALVLLVGCANVAGLLLVRGAARRRELGLRVALGATRGRLVRQLLVESLLLALGGGLAGLAVAAAGARFLLARLPGYGGNAAFHPDWRVLGFNLVVSIVIGVLVGLLPALRSSRVGVADALKEQGSGNTGGSRLRLTRALVIAQIAVTVCLLAGAGLFVQTLRKLRSTELGFETQRLLLFTLGFEPGRDAAKRGALFQEVLATLRTLPGVESATFAQGGLGNDTFRQNFSIVGDAATAAEPAINYSVFIGPDYLATTGIRLLQGSALEARDIFPSQPSAFTPCLVSEGLARKFFPGGDAVGRHLKTARGEAVIAGVVRDTKYKTLREETAWEIYYPYYLNVRAGRPGDAKMTFQLRASGNPEALTPSVRSALRRLDPGLTVSEVGSMDALIDAMLTQERSVAQMTGLFGLAALLLAAIRLYGTLAFDVARRTREIGVRIALGADASRVLRLVVRQGLLVAAAGCGLGLLSSLALARLVAGRLYGVTATDPLTLGATTALLLGVAAVASWIPARRAARVDPMVALRTE